MKTRILIAAIVALFIHGILFFVNFKFLSQKHDVLPATNVIRMTLSSKNQKTLKEYSEKSDIKVKHNKIAALQEQHEKEKKDGIC